MTKKNELYQCPFEKATKCSQDETCVGCETLAVYLREQEEKFEYISYGLLDIGATFQKGDEMFNDNYHKWEAIPENWIGNKFEPAGTTIERFNIQMRRKLGGN